jgi:alanyl aminopeptidase
MTHRVHSTVHVPLFALLAAACGGAGAPRPGATTAATDEPGGVVVPALADAPAGPLPAGVTPTAYRLELEVIPSRERFRGTAAIDLTLDAPTKRFFLHGARLDVEDVRWSPRTAASDGAAGEGSPDEASVSATWSSTPVEGVAAIDLPAPAPAGAYTLTIAYEAPFDRQLKGLYRVDEGGDHYAFTQFEATSARYAFPSFDEPRFKTPFETTLVVREDDVALSNTPEVGREPAGDGLRRIRFARTEPIPTYLVAMAVGPLDVVEAEPIPPNAVRDRPVPLRGVAARGKGGELARALEGTGPLLAELEDYFGSPYPYAKLDIVAVPDFASGAMENVGLVTFRETLLLLGDDPAVSELRGYTYVMAHELAHMWFGNLVTMPWWDDIWLNEAFATWMGHRVVDAVAPEYRAELQLLDRVHGAMARDSLESARQIRQPIETNHDIRNAFDPITYSKGGGVLRMVEAWLGADTFRDGLRRYMATHRFGTATAEDLLAALDAASGRDVAGPFRTFLFQSGVPLLTAELDCGPDRAPRASLAQRRYLPLGSELEADRRWQIPVCLRFGGGDAGEGRTCGLLSGETGSIPLDAPEGTCPGWLLPNADAAGYYRYRLPSTGLDALRREAWPSLSPQERLAVVDTLHSGLRDGSLLLIDVLPWLEPLSRDETRLVAMAPAAILTETREHYVPDALVPAVDAQGRALYRRRMTRIGLEARPDDAPTTRLLRGEIAGFLALTVDDPRTRRALMADAQRYLGSNRRRASEEDGPPYPDALPPDLVGAALTVAVEEGGADMFDALETLVRGSGDAFFRARALNALGHAPPGPDDLPARARNLVLDDALRGNERTIVLRAQMGEPALREAAWSWLQDHFDALVERVPTTRAGRLPWLATVFCDEDKLREVEAFFEPRVEALDGGPRNLAGATEAIRLCAARAEIQRPSATGAFRGR